MTTFVCLSERKKSNPFSIPLRFNFHQQLSTHGWKTTRESPSRAYKGQSLFTFKKSISILR